ncbi:MAG: isoaspartyl peptidase/L-asparaginase [Fervidicoccaceae archaeon]
MACTAAVAAHGGAGRWRPDRGYSAVERALSEAIERGLEEIERGALAAAVEAVRVLEDSGVLNAGSGSTLNSEGCVEMDAGVMDGSTGDAGAVGALRGFRNPVLAALEVMRSTPHVLLVGEGAARLAELAGLARLEPTCRGEAPAWPLEGRPWARALSPLVDTVGAVALDDECRLAAAASTGGITGKLPGRVGDTPIPGAGFYASRSAAVVATGIGEVIILESASRRAVELVERLGDLVEALNAVVSEVTARRGRGTLGLLGLDVRGRVGASHNFQAMPWGYAKLGERPRILGLPSL